MNSARMDEWKKKLSRDESAWESEKSGMDKRDQMYRGSYTFEDMTKREDAHTGEKVNFVYNALAENIEAQVSNDIPMPKVTARRKQDEHLAVLIENMIRNELDRIGFERINDMAERVVPIQGAGLYMVAWDNTQRTHGTVGEENVSFVHPKRFVPQDGVYDGIEDMDYFFLKIPTTKAAVKARYGVDVSDVAESEPEVKASGDGEASEDMVTQIVVYYRNERGGIGKYSWVNDTELEDLEDYQARRLTRCADCGAVEPMIGEIITDGVEEPSEWQKGDACPFCGGKTWWESEEDWEEVDAGSVRRSDGSPIHGTETYAEEALIDEFGNVLVIETEEPSSEKWKIPYYRPNRYPLVLQRNISVYGKLLGESDADKLAPMQHALNRVEQKIFDRLFKAGTKITLPANASFTVDTNDATIWRVTGVQDVNMIRVIDFSGDVTQERYEAQEIYQQMRQAVGVTDSYQGRKDATATSGYAKEFAAAQTAGRLESKRVQKEAAYAELFELMFKFRLAYADEPRPVVYQDGRGETVYDTFSKWDFLERDEAGDFWWNDQFLFSCDSAAPMANNRERLWETTTAQFTAGAFGDPTQDATRVAYWRLMETYHYPGAAELRGIVEERMTQAAASPEPPTEMPTETPPPDTGAGAITLTDADVEEMARQDALNTASAGR